MRTLTCESILKSAVLISLELKCVDFQKRLSDPTWCQTWLSPTQMAVSGTFLSNFWSNFHRAGSSGSFQRSSVHMSVLLLDQLCLAVTYHHQHESVLAAWSDASNEADQDHHRPDQEEPHRHHLQFIWTHKSNADQAWKTDVKQRPHAIGLSVRLLLAMVHSNHPTFFMTGTGFWRFQCLHLTLSLCFYSENQLPVVVFT